MDSGQFFSNWAGLIRIAVVAPLAYAALVLVLRVSGKRSLSSFNAFDLVVSVALGSTLATVILSKDVALAEGVVAYILLLGLQYLLAWLSIRSSRISSWTLAEPTLLVRRGQILREQVRRALLTEMDIAAAVRSQGSAAIVDIDAVILEADGSLSVIEGGGERLPAPLNE